MSAFGRRRPEILKRKRPGQAAGGILSPRDLPGLVEYATHVTGKMRPPRNQSIDGNVSAGIGVFLTPVKKGWPTAPLVSSRAASSMIASSLSRGEIKKPFAPFLRLKGLHPVFLAPRIAGPDRFPRSGGSSSATAGLLARPPVGGLPTSFGGEAVAVSYPETGSARKDRRYGGVTAAGPLPIYTEFPVRPFGTVNAF
jgi:hypothetical protein